MAYSEKSKRSLKGIAQILGEFEISSLKAGVETNEARKEVLAPLAKLARIQVRGRGKRVFSSNLIYLSERDRQDHELENKGFLQRLNDGEKFAILFRGGDEDLYRDGSQDLETMEFYAWAFLPTGEIMPLPLLFQAVGISNGPDRQRLGSFDKYVGFLKDSFGNSIDSIYTFTNVEANSWYDLPDACISDFMTRISR